MSTIPASRSPSITGSCETSYISIRYLPYGKLGRNREAMARFGQGLEAVEAIARKLV